MNRSDTPIYKSLERVLKEAGTDPQTHVDIYDDKEVRSLVNNVNKLPDYLDQMWRRRWLQRYFAAVPSAAGPQYAYTWKEAADGTAAPQQRKPSQRPHLRLVR